MLVTLQTLAEQMQLSEREQRKALVQFGAEDVACLRVHRDFIADCVDDVVREFYNSQLTVPEISLLIGDADTMSRLRIGVAVAGREYYPSMTDFIREADKNMYNSKSLSTIEKDFHIN